MATLVLVCRVVLAGVFAVSAVSKLADLAGARAAVVAFGAPKRPAGAFVAGLVGAELAVAGLLLPASTIRVGAAGALALLVLFSAAVGVSLARGHAPDCHCFGQLHSAPTSWKTLARNAGLAGLAAVALAGAVTGKSASAIAWIGRLDAGAAAALGAALAAAVALAGAAALCLSLLRSYGRVLVRLDRVERLLAENGLSLEDEDDGSQLGLAPGTPAPVFEELAGLLEPGLPLLLLFTSPRCGPCRVLLPEAAGWQVDHRDVLTVAVAVDGTSDEVRTEAARYELEHSIVDSGHGLYERFGASGTPSAVLIAPDGTIASRLATGADRIRSLVAHALAPEPPEPGLPLGAQLPPLELPALDGATVSLDELKGRQTLLVFWNPGCGHCRAMHKDLVDWERSVNGGRPRLVVVSSGDAASTRDEDFHSLVLLDGEFAAAELLGAVGTPSGLLVDAAGHVASRLAVGADATLALARGAL